MVVGGGQVVPVHHLGHHVSAHVSHHWSRGTCPRLAVGDPVGPGRVDGAAPPVLAADPITRVGAAAGPVAAAAVLS